MRGAIARCPPAVNSAGIMSVGNYGNGGMTIADGGNAQAFNIFVGSGETGVGDILVSGVAANGIRSGLLSAGSLYVGDNNDSVGGQPVNAGQGVLTVADDGVVTASQVYIGGRGGTGTVTVQGVNASGQEAQLNAEDVVVGMDSKGTLNIIDGGSVTDRSTIVGYDYGSTGSVLVSGTGSYLDTGSQLDPNGLLIGRSGQGTLVVADGATVMSPTIELAEYADAIGRLDIGNGGLAGTLDTASITGGAGVASVDFNHSDDIDFAPVLSGRLGVYKSNSSTTTLSSVNDYVGPTAVQAGTL
ncbi:TPA: hypothetical protein UN285_002024 [Stenotrophomonas maltophilia]|nr:hypothetical protein [Stenotrophomonas maltophilia]MBH1811285.1 hypothetical protein [Stenotrophomonas maltophilia]MBS6053633.1 hypothetical protein [Stenotrophomonas maltophilia]HEL4403262.1 hypothetical protein [Stenotrophomonas maltophilia]HEL4810856.1 hypothetical protein [Stenotrophomonas maltophilia]